MAEGEIMGEASEGIVGRALALESDPVLNPTSLMTLDELHR